MPVDISSFDCKGSSIQIKKKVSGISNPALVEYIKSRGLDPKLLGLYLCEVYYQIAGKNYFAVGFQNDSEGLEIRNKYFKGSIAPKDLSTIVNNSEECCIFEGFMDFLSYKQYVSIRETDYLVLNSVAMVNRCIEPLQKYRRIYYWGQNDEPGQTAFNTLLASGLQLIDCRFSYFDFKDLNEKYSKK
jgi:hypothetical protein